MTDLPNPILPDPALLALMDALAERDYRFTPVTPATHARVIAREGAVGGQSLRDIFGWNRSFTPDVLDDDLRRIADRARALIDAGDGQLRAAYRVSTLGELLFVHSPYPTEAEDSVFFGPDSLRFAALIEATADEVPDDAAIVDYGTGSGIGGIVAALTLGDAASTTLCDINPAALRLAATNAAHAGVEVAAKRISDPADIADMPGLILLHPPFMIDAAGRTYRDGGDMLGARLSYDWALGAADRLAPGGRVLMHTGVAIVDGEDLLERSLSEAAAARGLGLDYFELEADYYGEELDTPAYRDAGVERIAMVGVVLDKPPA